MDDDIEVLMLRSLRDVNFLLHPNSGVYVFFPSFLPSFLPFFLLPS